MALSKRLRFEILRRDNNQCRYCGATAPDVKLTIDHVVPTTLGGSDDASNLVTACADCNSGKSATPPDATVVADVAQDAMRWAEAMKLAAAEAAARDAEKPEAYAAVEAEWYRGSMPFNWQSSIDEFLAAGLPIETIVAMVRVAQNKRGEMGHRWSYFCGCCWNRVRQLQDRAHEIASREASDGQ